MFSTLVLATAPYRAASSDYAAPLEIPIPEWGEKVLAAMPAPDDAHIVFIRGGGSIFICKTTGGKILRIAAALAPDRYVRNGPARDYLEFTTVVHAPAPLDGVHAVTSSGRGWFFTTSTSGEPSHTERLYSFPVEKPEEITAVETGAPIEYLTPTNGGVLVTSSAEPGHCKFVFFPSETDGKQTSFTPDAGACPSAEPISSNGAISYFNRRSVYALSIPGLSSVGRFDTRDDVVFIVPDGDSIYAVTHRFNADVIGEFESSRLHSLDSRTLNQKALFTTTMKITSVIPASVSNRVIALAYKFDKPGNHIISLDRENLLRMADLPPDIPPPDAASIIGDTLVLSASGIATSFSPASLENGHLFMKGFVKGSEFFTTGCRLVVLEQNRLHMSFYSPANGSFTAGFPETPEIVSGARPIADSFPRTEDCSNPDPIYVFSRGTVYVF